MERVIRLRNLLYIFIAGLFLLSCGSGSGSGSFGGDARGYDEDTAAPATDPATSAAPSKANFNIYIENSGSMNGYVNGGTDFKNTVLQIITAIKSRAIGKAVNIYYINQEICPQKLNATPADIQSFFMNLSPLSFRNSGCGTSTSILQEIIKKSVTTKPDDVNVLISDFIFSDSDGTSEQYLELAKNALVMELSDELKKDDFSSIFVKFHSNFNGRYFVESRTSQVVDLLGKSAQRPYYLLITGKNNFLESLLDKINWTDYKGFENSYYLLTPTGRKPPTKLVRLQKKGNFDIVQPATQMTIANAAANPAENVFQFSFLANLSFLKIDDAYITDANNYDLSPNYEIVSIEKITDETNESLRGFTHIFTISTNDLKQRQDVSIKLRANVPEWVAQSSTLNDAEPLDSLQQQQTFGLKYLVQGIAQAYNNTYEGREQFAVTVKVNKNAASGGQTTASSGFPWWIIILAMAVVGVFIFLKSKK